MKIENSPKEIAIQRTKAVNYNLLCDYYSKSKQHENFYLGKQWLGINAPDLDKPVLNFIRRVCSFLTAMIAGEDISVFVSPYIHTDESTECADILNIEMGKIIEDTKLKSLCTKVVSDSVIKGDGFLYWLYENGKINARVIQSENVLFANPYEENVQRQPYILIEKREYAEEAKTTAAKNGGQASLVKEDAPCNQAIDAAPMVSLVTKLYRKDGEIWYTVTSREAVVIPPENTHLTVYPIAKMCWEKETDTYHGVGAVENLIPNQIAVNKLWAMALLHQKTMAFPKIFFDKTKPDTWTNKVGAAIGVIGNPNEVVATTFKAGDMSQQVMEIVEKTVSMTKEFMGANDSSLGNVDPKNTSAIIALQRAATIPLQLQKQAFSQFMEDCVIIIFDIISKYYKQRMVEKASENGVYTLSEFDFSAVNYSQLVWSIQADSSTPWSESVKVRTLEDLYAKQIITDAYDYVQAIPSSQLSNKQQILDKLKENYLTE